MATAAARAALESLLRTRKLDTTLTTASPEIHLPSERLTRTSLAVLDRALGGGFSRGQVSELVGRRSSGRTATITALLSGATARGELVAVIDALDRFDPASAAAAGVELDHVLWVRGEDAASAQLTLETSWEPAGPGRRRESPMRRAVSRALKALALVLSSGGFGVVVLDLGDVPARVVATLPFTTWLRLQRMVAGSDTAVILLADVPVARSSGGATVRLTRRQVEPQSSGSVANFRERVLASRRPFLGSATGMDRQPSPAAPAGVWTGAPAARRFRGLAVDAHVQAGLRTSDAAIDLVR